MYRVITVDDEFMIHLSLKKIIESSGAGFEIAGTAEDGREALELLKQSAVDVVITDICMPEMDGLSFIEQAKQMNPRLKFVILSGHNDFEYAQKAIRFGVSEFLLKPVNIEQVQKTMATIRSGLEQEHRQFARQTLWMSRMQQFRDELVSFIWSADETNAMRILDDIYRTMLDDRPDSQSVRQWFAELLAGVEQAIAQRNFHFAAAATGYSSWTGDDRLLLDAVKADVSGKINELRRSRNLGSRQNILKAMEYMKANFAREELSLQEVADSVGMSVAYFSRQFKEEMNLNFVHYLTRLRMDKAKSLLEDPAVKTLDIPYLIGYSDYPHFSKTFKKLHAITPSHYRKQLAAQPPAGADG